MGVVTSRWPSLASEAQALLKMLSKCPKFRLNGTNQFRYLGQNEVVDDLIRSGANVSAANKNGRTALIQAAQNGN